MKTDAQTAAIADLLEAHDSYQSNVQGEDREEGGVISLTFYSHLSEAIETYRVFPDGEVDA